MDHKIHSLENLINESSLNAFWKPLNAHYNPSMVVHTSSPSLRRVRQKDPEFQACLDYVVRS
jgi:hypothetical protein